MAKEAYGVPAIEIWIDPKELLAEFKKNGLKLLHTETIFMEPDGYGHLSYVLSK
jgi:hypothetical protein